MECIQLQSYQNMLHYQHLHTDLFNDFLLIHIHQDLLRMPHPLFYVNYSSNKHH